MGLSLSSPQLPANAGSNITSNNNNNNHTNENQRVPFFQKIISIIVQMLIMHMVMYFLSGGKNNMMSKSGIMDRTNVVLKNSFEKGDIFDIYIFLSNNQSLDFEYLKNNSKLINIREKELYNHKTFSSYEKLNYTFNLNDSWKDEKYLSVVLVPIHFYKKRNYPLIKNTTLKYEFKDKVLVENIPLTVKMVPFESEEEEKYNLMDPSNNIKRKNIEEQKKKKRNEQLYHIKRRIDINIIYDDGKHMVKEFKMPYFKNWKVNLTSNTYTPPIFLSDFWLIEKDYYVLDDNFLKSKDKRVNYICTYDPYMLTKKQNDIHLYITEQNMDENKKLHIEINYGTCSFIYFMFIKQISYSLNMMNETAASAATTTSTTTTNNNNNNNNNKIFSIQNITNITANKEVHMMKKILMTTNIYMLIFSAIFILLHSIFSFFAFKNDMQFWYKNESMEGLSALSVITAFVCDIILALYLYDSEKTSWLLLFEMFIGVALSAWKVTKAVHVSFSKKYPFIIFKDKKNYTESMTKKYDKIAIKYVGILLIPCLIGYAIYALFYFKYKSWYSYIISVLAGTVYTFGFIMMTPQLYINYKLKSVEHLPWKALIYKSLNTFIDDVAFFLIDMPWMHKLSCFRDDIIFLCYIYQRCIYKVDKNRNETLTQNEKIDNNNNANQNDQLRELTQEQNVVHSHDKKND
ncbi:conserved Plasmodium membrane protein, unknown function [Plasmodium sp. gorilla clade G1]|nr:conserved Plasmodium membrane protein, unknown function [Plasmodium sp. gorilla clade G1]